MTRLRSLNKALIVGTFTAALCGAAMATTTYPDKPIRVVVPYAPGGATDILARMIGKQLSENLGQPVVIENKTGGNTSIAATQVAHADADGYTLLFTNDTTFVLNPALFKSLSYDIDKEFRPVGTVCDLTLGLVVSSATPANSIKELAAYIKADTDKPAYGSFGVGSQAHLMGEMYNQVTDSKVTHAPYRGSSPAVIDVIGGQVLFTFPAMATIQGHLKAGKVKVLALSGEERSPLLPDVPTFTEAGYPELNIGAWYGFLAPAGTPDAVVDKLNRSLSEVLDKPDFRKDLIAQGTIPLKLTPDQFKQRMSVEIERTKKIAEMANISID
ncbi:Bug family tripartite tricarboxylate transporter substrate binding protein [Bordetella tumulicola]|uniref:Bug family tripartite tricarboxylate transporter substrate binding protein n=1 Tax=Bordetella tumulicola TaxID=1649133 RepID=UPI0039EDFC43